MIGKGLEWHLIAQLLFYASANLVPMALPLAVLLASIMTFGNFGENYELVAIKSAGISLQKAMRPLMVVACIIALFSFVFMNNIWPVANLKMKTLLYDITHKKPALDIKEKVYYKEIEKFVIRVENKGDDGQTLYGVSIYDHTQERGNTKIIRADSGRMRITDDEKNLVFELFHGTSYEELESDNESKDNYPVFRTTFEKEKVVFDMSSFALSRSDEDLFKDNYEMLTLSQIEDELDSAKRQKETSIKRFREYISAQVKLFSDSISLDSSNYTTTLSDSGWFSTFPDHEQLIIVQNASALVRNAKSYSEASKHNLEAQQSRSRRLKIEWHRKFTIAYMCLILFFVGAPMGAITKKGGLGMPVLISIIFFIFYYVISITGEKLVKQGSFEAFYGMWLAPVILTPLAAWLTYKSTSDSKLFSLDSYKIFFRKLFAHNSAPLILDEQFEDNIPKVYENIQLAPSERAYLERQINYLNKQIDTIEEKRRDQGITVLISAFMYFILSHNYLKEEKRMISEACEEMKDFLLNKFRDRQEIIEDINNLPTFQQKQKNFFILIFKLLILIISIFSVFLFFGLIIYESNSLKRENEEITNKIKEFNRFGNKLLFHAKEPS